MNSKDINHLKQYRILLIKFLGGQCQRCGEKKKLIIHHKKYQKQVQLEDIELLCKKCHPTQGAKKPKTNAKKFLAIVSKMGTRKVINVPINYAYFSIGTKVTVSPLGVGLRGEGKK